jgi:hypothetical protein
VDLVDIKAALEEDQGEAEVSIPLAEDEAPDAALETFDHMMLDQQPAAAAAVAAAAPVVEEVVVAPVSSVVQPRQVEAAAAPAAVVDQAVAAADQVELKVAQPAADVTAGTKAASSKAAVPAAASALVGAAPAKEVQEEARSDNLLDALKRLWEAIAKAIFG